MRAVTRNLNRRPAGTEWVHGLATGPDAPDILFLQETPAALLDHPPAGYRLVRGREEPGSAVGVVSSLLVTEHIGELRGDSGPRPFAALGTYAAAALLRHRGDDLWVVSVHASPSRISSEKLRADFPTRSCEPEPWWSDAFIAELRLFAARQQPAVIAGDLNQTEAWDRDHPGHVCGREFFEWTRDAGFIDVTRRDWGQDRPTRHNPDYQLDRVLASVAVASLLKARDTELVHDDASDHAAIWFDIGDP